MRAGSVARDAPAPGREDVLLVGAEAVRQPEVDGREAEDGGGGAGERHHRDPPSASRRPSIARGILVGRHRSMDGVP